MRLDRPKPASKRLTVATLRPTTVAMRRMGMRAGAAARWEVHSARPISVKHSLNAINLALDATWRFDGMPREFHLDWLRVAAEEAHHFSLLREHLQSLGMRYGELPAHDTLWTMCEKTSDDVVARMALVPRTLEARGLDATPQIQEKLRKVGTPAAQRAVEILDIILRDEIGHVAVGNHWYRWLCQRQGLDPIEHYDVLAARHAAPRLYPPFNEAARRQAGFADAELRRL